MAGGVTLQVRQIGSYAAVGGAGGGDLLLMQPGGLGNPYASVDAQTLVKTALNSNGTLGVGTGVPADAVLGQIFTATNHILPLDASMCWNTYFGSEGDFQNWVGGPAGAVTFGYPGWAWTVGAGAAAGQPVTMSVAMTLSVAGALALPFGTLSVARDPLSALEVATMGYVGANTVNSFNGRKGAVTLNGCDIYAALCLDSTIATENWVNANIQASIQMLLANHPFVFGWNGRTGAVYLTLADISCVFFQPGQQPITQTPPLTSNDYSIPNTAWVVEYIANEFAGGGGNLATQTWVLANTVNSFNGRQGVVTLTSADVYDVGAAPLNSPAFSGIPTAPTAAVGQATGQIATTAFVQQAITNNTAGVSTFNTRTGDVTLEAADVIAAGGLTNPSANLTGSPTCPTQPPGTNLPVLANCEFVQAAISAGTVVSFNTRQGAVTLTLADVTGVGGAPLVSPAFSSVPTAPTAAPGTNTVQLATCAFVQAALTAAGGVSSFNSRTGAVTLTANDVSAVGALVNPSVGLTGSPTATTATAGDNSTRIATTAFVQTALSAGAVSSFNTRTGAVTLQAADITAAGGALLASPAFTGAPTAPTAAAGTNNTQIATTAYVTAAILADTTGVTSFNTRTGAVSLILADITGAGGAPLASPSFTGVPLGPTATPGTSTTQLATTAFVQNAIASSGVSSFNARTGAVTLIANDISAAGGALLAGPTFTGVPAAPTAAPGTNTTQLATTAFVAAALSAGGGYLPLAGGTITGSLGLVTAPPGNAAAGSLIVGGTGSTVTAGNIGGNVYWDGTNWRYVATGAGWLTAAAAPSSAWQWIYLGQGNAGAIISSSTGAMTLGGTGQLSVSGGMTAPSYALTNSGLNTFGPSASPAGGGYTLTTASYGYSNQSEVDPAWQWASTTTVLMALYSTGNLTIHGTLTQGSDETSKENINPIQQGVSLVRQLLPKSFQRIIPEGSPANATNPVQWGFIAQDVEPVIPAAITSIPAFVAGGSATLALDETAIVAALVNAVKQLLSRLEALESAAGITPPAEAVA